MISKSSYFYIKNLHWRFLNWKLICVFAINWILLVNIDLSIKILLINFLTFFNSLNFKLVR